MRPATCPSPTSTSPDRAGIVPARGHARGTRLQLRVERFEQPAAQPRILSDERDELGRGAALRLGPPRPDPSAMLLANGNAVLLLALLAAVCPQPPAGQGV